VTDFAQIRRAAMEIEGPREGSLEARAAVMFKILAVVNAAGIVLALFPPIIPVSTLHTLGFNAGAALLAALYWLVAKALDRKESWAVAVVRPLLIPVAIAGAYATLVGFEEGKNRIPFEIALAAWALIGPADARPLPRLAGRGIAALAIAVALLAAQAFGERVFGWGGALDVREADLSAALAVTCGEPGSDPPATIPMTYEWRWQRTSPFPSGADMLVIGWSGSDGEGRPLYVVGRIPENTIGIQAGREGYPSEALGKAAAGESKSNYRWAIDLGQQQLAPGRIELDLRFARDEVPEAGSVELRASYIHLGEWRHLTTATCTW
jgi:hypothetical protein